MLATQWVIVAPGTHAATIVSIGRRLVIGRECVGIPVDERLVVEDPAVSRGHLEAADDGLRSTIGKLEAGRLTIVDGDPLAALTVREREILALIAQGHSNPAIARRLSP